LINTEKFNSDTNLSRKGLIKTSQNLNLKKYGFNYEKWQFNKIRRKILEILVQERKGKF